jgi:hypothetical protein
MGDYEFRELLLPYKLNSLCCCLKEEVYGRGWVGFSFSNVEG